MFYYWITWQEEIHGQLNLNIDHETLNEYTYNLCYDAYMYVNYFMDFDDVPY